MPYAPRHPYEQHLPIVIPDASHRIPYKVGESNCLLDIIE